MTTGYRFGVNLLLILAIVPVVERRLVGLGLPPKSFACFEINELASRVLRVQLPLAFMFWRVIAD
ncbi:MAG: hypothetical protein RLY14_1847, partial [Planctomycetota bacterium]